MTSTGRSNNDVIAEAVAAIGPYKAWIGAKRTEIQGQIAQMQAASAAATTTSTGDSSLASRFRQLGLPQRNGGTPSAPQPAASEGTEGVDATMTATEGTGSAALPTTAEEPVSVPTVPPTGPITTSSAALPTLLNQQEAQAYLDTVFATTPAQTLPIRVVTAWEGRTADSKYNARMLIGAKEAGVLSAELAHGVSAMITFDAEFATVYQLYEGHFYKELFDIGLGGHGPDEEQQDDAAEEYDVDGEEGESDAEEEERQWGFPGEDSRESPF